MKKLIVISMSGAGGSSGSSHVSMQLPEVVSECMSGLRSWFKGLPKAQQAPGLPAFFHHHIYRHDSFWPTSIRAVHKNLKHFKGVWEPDATLIVGFSYGAHRLISNIDNWVDQGLINPSTTYCLFYDPQYLLRNQNAVHKPLKHRYAHVGNTIQEGKMGGYQIEGVVSAVFATKHSLVPAEPIVRTQIMAAAARAINPSLFVPVRHG